jgi:hypothetical protein
MRTPAHIPESRRTLPTHAMHTHPLTLPIPPSLPTLVVGVLGGGASNNLPPNSLTPHPKGGLTRRTDQDHAVFVVCQGAQLCTLLQPVGVG